MGGNSLKKVLKLLTVCLILLTTVFSASAAIYNEAERNAGKSRIYVIGNPDLYPVEYYNEKSGEFEGILPEMLGRISSGMGMDFSYINPEDTPAPNVARKNRAELITTYVSGGESFDTTNMVPLLNYSVNGMEIIIGWKATEYAEKHFVEALRVECARVPADEVFAVATSFQENSKAPYRGVPVSVFVLVLVAVCVVFVMALRHFKRRLTITETTDPLTGIANLSAFEQSFHNKSDELDYIAYIVVDSNYLQAYYGETILTDAVRYIADSLTAFAMEDELVARITENGFAYVFKGRDEENAILHIEELIFQLMMFLERDDGDVHPYFRAVAYALRRDDRNSDLLLFNLRRNCNQLISTDKIFDLCTDSMMNLALEEKAFLDDVEKGFANKEFKLYVQFIVDNATKNIMFAEALSRWEKEGDVLVMPGQYIGELEKHGRIVEFDYYMFEQTCMQLHKWAETELDPVSISCNITRITLSEKDFAERIGEIANRYIFDRSKLIVEITEDAIERNRDEVVNNILGCKRLGFRVALDDLGFGNTSLVNLCDYPVDIVKIDRSIMWKTDTKNGRDLFTGIVALAHSLGLKVICEGVENEEHNTFVSGTDCDYIQGWYYSRPTPAKAGEEFYKSFSPDKFIKH